MLNGTQRARYGRQLLLPEIGEAGQQKLLAARLRTYCADDAAAAAVAVGYLNRAGLKTEQTEAAGEAFWLPTAAQVDRVAGAAQLREASAALLGAFAAVEAIKQVTGAGSVGTFPADFVLAKEW